MPLSYGLVAFHHLSADMLKPPVAQHIAFNSLANVVVMLAGLRTSGRFDQRLGQVFTSTMVAHGALAFFTLITRHYYSIPMMLFGVVASAVLGTAAMVLAHRGRRLRVGLLGPWHPIAAEGGLDSDCVESPEASIRPYDLLLVTFPGEPPPAWSATFSRAMLAGKRVRHVAEYAEEARGVVDIDRFELDHLPAAGFTSYRVGKRLLDIAIAIATVPISAPIVLLAGLAIRLTMGPRVFFSQERVGLGGKRFRILKLRTMRAGGAAGVATQKGDSRITPLGRWLRRFHIDELPQLWNVFIGEMSLVGPRPEQPNLAEAYSRGAPAFAYRQLVRPGITGWAQVRAPYAADFAETEVKLGYDLFYLKYFSFALDVQILARTVWTIVSGGGVR